MKFIDSAEIKGSLSITDYLSMSIGTNDGIRLYGITPTTSSQTNGLAVFHIGDDLGAYESGGEALVFRFGSMSNSIALTSDITANGSVFKDAMSLKTTASSTITTIYNAFNLNYITSNGILLSDSLGNITANSSFFFDTTSNTLNVPNITMPTTGIFTGGNVWTFNNLSNIYNENKKFSSQKLDNYSPTMVLTYDSNISVITDINGSISDSTTIEARPYGTVSNDWSVRHLSNNNNPCVVVSNGLAVGGILNLEGSALNIAKGTQLSTDGSSQYMPKIKLFNHSAIWTGAIDASTCSSSSNSNIKHYFGTNWGEQSNDAYFVSNNCLVITTDKTYSNSLIGNIYITTPTGEETAHVVEVDSDVLNLNSTNIYLGTATSHIYLNENYLPLATPSNPGALTWNGASWYFNNTSTNALSTTLTGYVVGTNTALSATDTILTAFGKLQAEINARPGTVTSVSLTAPALMTVTGSPITSSGTLALAWNGTSSYFVLANGGTVATSTYALTSSLSSYIPLSGSSSLAGSIIPSTTNTYSLGSSSYVFSNMYASYFNGNLTGNATTATTASAVAWAGITYKPAGMDNRGAARLYRGDAADGYWLSHSWSDVCFSYFGSNSWYLTASNSGGDSQGGIHTVLVDYAGLSVNSLQLGGIAASSYLLSSTAASTYLPFSTITPFSVGSVSVNNYWGKLATLTITSQWGSASAVVRIADGGGDVSNLNYAATIKVNMKHQTAMTDALNYMACDVESSVGIDPADIRLIKTVDTSSTKTCELWIQWRLTYSSVQCLGENKGSTTFASSSLVSAPTAEINHITAGTNTNKLPSLSVVNLSSSNPVYSSGFKTNVYANTGLVNGTGDGASYTVYNQSLASWWGTGIYDGCNGKCTGFIDHRSGNLTMSGSITANTISIVGDGIQNLFVGNDASFGDCNTASTISLQGSVYSNKGFLKFGSSGPIVGYDGSTFNIPSTLTITGLITANGGIKSSAAAALSLTANGSGTYMTSVLYQDASGVYLERGLASESGSASPLPFYVSKRGGGGPYPFLVNANDVTTNTMLYANGGISGNLTGHASLDLPLTGGTMSGNLLGGTPYNIGATSNWWGSIYATTIYESNVALSSKYLGVNGTASNAAALGGKSPSWYLPGGQYFIPGSAGAPDYTLLFTVVFSSQYQGFNNEVYISGRYDASRYSIAIGNDANTANVYVSKFGSPINDAGRIKYIVTNTSSYHNTVKVYLVRLSWDYTTDYSFGSSTGSYDSYAENSSPTPTTTDPGVTAPTLSTFGYNTIANTVTAAGGFVGSLTGHASLDLPLSGGTMNAGAKILTLQDMTISTGANTNYANAPFVAQRNTINGITTHASIGFHNRGANAAALFYHAANSNFWFNDHIGGLYQLWSSKDFASQSITNWTTAYNWGNHASAGYLLASTAASTYLPIGGTASNASALGGVAADYFVQGTGYDDNSTYGKRTTCFSYNKSTASSTCLTDPLSSGFYDGSFTARQTPNNTWAFIINTAHSNSNAVNKFQFQIAAGFGNKYNTSDWGAENYWVRVINPNGVGDWRTLIHSDNYTLFNNFTSGITVKESLSFTSDVGGGFRFGPISGSTTWVGLWHEYDPGSSEINATLSFDSRNTRLNAPSLSSATGNLLLAIGGSDLVTLSSDNLSVSCPFHSKEIYINGSLRVKYQEKSADYTVTDRDCGTIIAMTNTGLTMTIQAGSNYIAGFHVDISGPGGGTISSYIHFTDAWYLNGNAHAAGTNLGLQSETASIRYVAGVWYVSLP